MEIIELDKIGLIKAGKNLGFYIKILFDEKETGGYYILTCRKKDFTGEVFDAWFEDFEKLERYFAETSIVVDWDS